MRKLLYGCVVMAVSWCFNTKIWADRFENITPDSIIYQLNDLNTTSKIIYQYNGNDFTATTYNFDDASFKWIPNKQTLLQTNDGVGTLIEKYYSQPKGAFLNFHKLETQIDSQGICTLWANYSWDSIQSNWKGLFNKTERSYSDSGQLNSFTNSSWDSIAGKWVFFSKGTFSYTNSGKPDTAIYFIPDANGLPIYSSRIISNYLADGKINMETVYAYDPTVVSFNPVFRNRFEYRDTIPQITELVELFNANNNQWFGYQKSESGYDTKGNLASYMIADKDTLNQLWIERYRHNLSVLSASDDSIDVKIVNAPAGIEISTDEYKAIRANSLTYLSKSTFKDNTLSSIERSSVNEQSGKLISIYNSDTDYSTRTEWSFDNNIMNLNFFSTNPVLRSESLSRSMTIYFRSVPTSTEVNVKQKSTLTFYPNPVKEQFNIANPGTENCIYRILTLDGKPVKTGAANEKTNTISVTGLATGPYLLQLSTAKESVTKILIKE